MNNKFIGYILIVVSLISISFELFSLKVIQILDFGQRSTSYENSLDYIFETPILISFFILVLILIWGIVKIKK